MSDTRQFQELFEVPIRNGVYVPKDKRGIGYKMLNMGEIFHFPKIPDMEMERVSLTQSEVEKSLLKKNDLLFARRSLVLSGAGKCSLFVGSSGTTTFESSIIRVRLNSEIALPVFYFYYFNSPQGRSLIETIVEQVAVAGIRGSDLAELQVPFPPLDEQRAVAEILSSLDDKIELNSRINETLEETARAIFKSWFLDFDPVHAKAHGEMPIGMDEATASLFPGSFEESELGPIPSGWTIGRVDNLFVLQRGFDLPEKERILGDFPIIAASGFAGNHNEYRVEAPGVTTGRSGLIGEVFYVQSNFWPLNTSLWVKEFRTASPLYSYHFLKTLDLKKLNSGSAVPSLNRNYVHNLPAIIPNPTLVQFFENAVKPLFLRIRQSVDESKTLAEIRNSLLPKLVSGEIRVGELEL